MTGRARKKVAEVEKKTSENVNDKLMTFKQHFYDDVISAKKKFYQKKTNNILHFLLKRSYFPSIIT